MKNLDLNFLFLFFEMFQNLRNENIIAVTPNYLNMLTHITSSSSKKLWNIGTLLN